MTRREALRLLAFSLLRPPAVPMLRLRSHHPQDGMRQVADHAGLRWGVMMPSAHVGTLLARDPLYRQACLDNFNLVAIPDFGWARVEPELDAWQLGPVSAAADFAAAAGMVAMGMHLLWGPPSQIPAWLRRSPDPRALRDQAVRHVGAVVRAMHGRVAVWSVLNELDGAPWVAGSDFWRAALTPEDMADVFRRVREEDPKAMLLLNDFGIEVPGGPGFMESRRDRLLSLVVQLRSHNAPIDGIGFQTHLDASNFADTTVRRRRLSLFRENVRLFQNAGVQVCVTELDVRVDAVKGSISDRLSIQADVYEEVLEAALQAGVSSVTFWGLSDRYATDEISAGLPQIPGPRLFDQAMQPKPSYYAAQRALRGRAPP